MSMQRCRALIAGILLVAAAAVRAEVAVVPAPASDPALREAAAELAEELGRLYPASAFTVADVAPAAGDVILLGTCSQAPVRAALGDRVPTAPESYRVCTQAAAGRRVGVIAGADVRGAVFGMFALLEKLGLGYYLSFSTRPDPRKEPFDFAGWDLADAPLAGERIVFNWHNFLSGCSSWNLPDWQLWIDQSRRMRFNTVMVHAYGNNPMFTFTCNGVTKPAGYLTTTAKGRDWGTEHINDVRRLPGGSVFSGPVFGADAALAPDAQRVEASQALMKQVFAHAARRGMHLCFALDVDTEYSNPQDVIKSLPAAARFCTADGQRWFARPDTPEGYAYYRAQMQALFDLYPQIDRLVIWIRTGGTWWTELKAADLPPAWRKELEQRLAHEPALKGLGQGPGRLGLGKVVEACRRALQEIGRGDVRLWAGSWNY